jgi:D-alanine-D-alanine ligase
MQALRKLTKDCEDLSINIDSIEMRNRPESGSRYATMYITVRFGPSLSFGDVDVRVQGITQSNSRDSLDIHLRRGLRRAPVAESEASRRLFDRIAAVAEKLDLRVGAIQKSRPSDMSHVPAGSAVVDGCGPIGSSYLTQQEYIYRDSLIDRAALLAVLLRRCANERGRQ